MKYFYLIMFLTLLSACGPVQSSDLKDDQGFAMEADEIAGFKLFYNENARQYCTGAWIQNNAVIVSTRCFSASDTMGSGGLSFKDTNGSKIYAVDYYRLKIGTEFVDNEPAAAAARAKNGVVIAVFPDDSAGRSAGVKDLSDVRLLSQSGPSTESGHLRVYMVGYGKRKDESVLAYVATKTVDTQLGYFVAEVPRDFADSGHDGESLVSVNWDATGALVLNENRELIGIVSSVLDHIIVKGQREPGRYALISDVHSDYARRVYRQAIKCPTGRKCAKDFKNSGVNDALMIDDTVVYANRENRRCALKIKQRYNTQRGILEGVDISGIDGPCANYRSSFDRCSDNECESIHTCESLTIDPAGFTLKTGGKAYSFGRQDRMKKRDVAGIPEFSSSLPNPCLTQQILEPHETKCRVKGNSWDGSKWLWFQQAQTFGGAKSLCTKYGYDLLSVEEGPAYFADVKHTTETWIDKIYSKDDIPDAPTPFPKRGFMAFEHGEAKSYYTPVTPKKTMTAACYCKGL